jgi:hypothetical protein
VLNIVHKERRKKRRTESKRDTERCKNLKKVSFKWAKGAFIKQRGQKKKKNICLVKGNEGEFREVN